jgi:hypothetical protein
LQGKRTELERRGRKRGIRNVRRRRWRYGQRYKEEGKDEERAVGIQNEMGDCVGLFLTTSVSYADLPRWQGVATHGLGTPTL